MNIRTLGFVFGFHENRRLEEATLLRSNPAGPIQTLLKKEFDQKIGQERKLINKNNKGR
jgi:hypothetical protein